LFDAKPSYDFDLESRVGFDSMSPPQGRRR
jgi:hypothetical protein